MAFEYIVLAAFGAMLFWGVGDFLIQRSVRKIGSIECLTWIGIIATLLLLPLVVHDFHLLSDTRNIAVLGILGIVTFFAAIADFEALKQGKLSVIEIVMTIELPVTVMLALVFLQEHISLMQGIAIFSVFIGITLIAVERFSKIGSLLRSLEKGVAFALIGGLGMGVMNVLTGWSAKSISPVLAIWGPHVVFMFLCFLVIIGRKEGIIKFANNWKKYHWLILLTGIFDVMAWLMYAFALEQKEIALTTAISESYPAVALLLGLWLNRERIMKHQYIGVGIALAASIMLGFVL